MDPESPACYRRRRAGAGYAARHGLSGTVRADPARLRGLLLEYIGAPAQLVHYGAGIVLGGGIAQIVDLPFDPQFDGDLDQSAVFVAEPSARLELNVTTHFRLGLAGGYRLVQGSDMRGVSNTDLSGPFGRLSFRFGQF